MNEPQAEPTFESFGLKEELNRGITAAGFKTPSPIQLQAIPLVLSGADLIAQAHTGTGKTAAFGLPAMQMINMDSPMGLLVITPTRELATQVSEEIYRLGQFAGVKSGAIYGGQAYFRQLRMIENGVHALVATPGRLLDLLRSGKLPGLKPSIVVLDEADEMLDMGFLEDIQEIFKLLPEQRQTLLFSATMPPPIQALAKTILKDPQVIQSAQQRERTNSDIQQLYFVVEEREREDAVIRLIDDQFPDKAIVFCRTRIEVDRLNDFLLSRGFNSRGLHGDIDQYRRDETMLQFRQGSFDILVATDVAARGLDVAAVSHVFNYHIPFDSKSYVHRVGRTGRAGKKGTAITLVTPREFQQLERIRLNIGAKIERRAVPCLRQLRLSRLGRLREALCDSPVLPEAQSLIQALEQEMGHDEIARRLVSVILSWQKESGPESIGLDEEQFQAMTNPQAQTLRRRRPQMGARTRQDLPGTLRPAPLAGQEKTFQNTSPPEVKLG